ncbi:hypothetical protein LTR10_008622 [Elasticomyces elasticus]|nr:hypothetical protein LTR10_008622 [Elasticomyces elasticus]
MKNELKGYKLSVGQMNERMTGYEGRTVSTQTLTGQGFGSFAHFKQQMVKDFEAFKQAMRQSNAARGTASTNTNTDTTTNEIKTVSDSAKKAYTELKHKFDAHVNEYANLVLDPAGGFPAAQSDITFLWELTAFKANGDQLPAGFALPRPWQQAPPPAQSNVPAQTAAPMPTTNPNANLMQAYAPTPGPAALTMPSMAQMQQFQQMFQQMQMQPRAQPQQMQMQMQPQAPAMPSAAQMQYMMQQFGQQQPAPGWGGQGGWPPQ